MKNLKIIYTSVLLLMVPFVFSCKKDQLNSKELLAYIKGTGQSNTFTITQNPVSAKAVDSVYKFAGFLTRPTSADVTVNVAVEASAINELNAKDTSSVKYQLLPAESYKIKGNSKFNIPAGSAVASDSIEVMLTNYKNLDRKKKYVLPLSIKSIESKDVGVQSSNNFKTVFIYVDISYTYINQSLTGINGALIDRKSPEWKVVKAADALTDSYAASNILDGDNTTYWFAELSNINFITIDMGQANSIHGISLTPNYFGLNYNPLVINVQISKDNITWTDLGDYQSKEIDPSSNSSNPDIRNINFYAPLSCRYFKLTLKNIDYSGFAEVNAF